MQKQTSIRAILELFGGGDDGLSFIFEQRFGNIEKCPKCHQKFNYKRIENRKCFQCRAKGCTHQIYPLKDTIFEGSTTPLYEWFCALSLFYNSKNGVSADEVSRTCGITYKAAWRMCNRIRSKMKCVTDSKMSGTIEMDETFVGCRKKLDNKGNKGIGDKMIVLGMRSRETDEIRLFHIAKKDRGTILSIVKDNIEEGATIYTDKYIVYSGIGSMGYNHKVIGSKKRKSEVHTSAIETVWSGLKKSLFGTYTHVSSKHLQNYLHEFVYNYNNREASFKDFVKKILS